MPCIYAVQADKRGSDLACLVGDVDPIGDFIGESLSASRLR